MCRKSFFALAVLLTFGANWGYSGERPVRAGLRYPFSVHDVGTASVDQPPDTVVCSDSVPVAATVCNYGDFTESFDVEAIIDSSGVPVYADTQTVVVLTPDSCTSVSFADWVVPPVHGVSYTVTVTTLLPTDENPANDTLSKSVFTWCPSVPHDVGTASVDQPPDTVACDDSVPVAATVCNYGNFAESFDVEAIIDSSGVLVYADTQTVVGLSPGDCTSVSFADWVVPPIHRVSYTVTVTTLLATDENPANDALSKSVLAWCPSTYHDVGTASVDQPPDTVVCSDSVPVAATVCNYGDFTESFDVEAIIDSSGVPVYADTQAVVVLTPDSCTSVSFADWIVPPIHGVSYTVTVTTLLAGDKNPANDTLSKSVFVWCPSVPHDVGTASVDQPRDTVPCCSDSQLRRSVPVAATVCNYGNFAESFNVEAIIDSSGVPVYADTQTVVALSPDSCTSVSFADWVVPPIHGVSYTVAVTTLLPTDNNRTNDTRTRGIFAWCPSNDTLRRKIRALWPQGVEEITILAGPSTYSLGQPRPNPAMGWASIDYQLLAKCKICLRLYDLKGTVVRTLAVGVEDAGFHTAVWDGRDDRGNQAPSGIYFYKLKVLPQGPGQAERLVAFRKLILLK